MRRRTAGPAPRRQPPKRPRPAAPTRVRAVVPDRVPAGFFGLRPKTADAPPVRKGVPLSARRPAAPSPAQRRPPTRAPPGDAGQPAAHRASATAPSNVPSSSSASGRRAVEEPPPPPRAAAARPASKPPPLQSSSVPGGGDGGGGGGDGKRDSEQLCAGPGAGPVAHVAAAGPGESGRYAAPRTRGDVDAQWGDLPWRIGRGNADDERRLLGGCVPRLTEICFGGLRRAAASGRLGSIRDDLPDDVVIRVLSGAREDLLLKLEARNPCRVAVLDAAWAVCSGEQVLEPRFLRWREMVERKRAEERRALDEAAVRLRARYSEHEAEAGRRVVSSTDVVSWGGRGRARRGGGGSGPSGAISRIRRQVRRTKTLATLQRHHSSSGRGGRGGTGDGGSSSGGGSVVRR
jgi:hypothetical protein